MCEWAPVWTSGGLLSLQESNEQVQQTDTGQTWQHTKKTVKTDSSRSEGEKNRKPPEEAPIKDIKQKMQDWRSRLQKVRARRWRVVAFCIRRML